MAQPVAPVKKVPIHLQVSVYKCIWKKVKCYVCSVYILYANEIPIPKE